MSLLSSSTNGLAGRDGLLDLQFERDDDGLTRPRRAMARPPLQCSRVRYDDPADPQRAVMTILTLGGVLSGDRNRQLVRLGQAAHATILMAAATQVLAMPHGFAEQSLRIELAEQSDLNWYAEPLILFGRSHLRQQTEISLAPGARLTFFDILVPGRLARGEFAQFERYQSSIEICTAHGRLLAAEAFDLCPQQLPIAHPGLFNPEPVIGSLWMLGDPIDSERIVAQVSAWDAPDLGVTTLPNQAGTLVRVLGSSGSMVRQRLGAIAQKIDSGCATMGS
jgi:urease accessory protein